MIRLHDGDPNVWDDIEDTEIPSVQRFLHELVLKKVCACAACWDAPPCVCVCVCQSLVFKYFNGGRFAHQVVESATEASSSHNVVVNPMVVAAPWLTHQ